ncbi:MAG: NCS2 family permease [Synergistaceae bacterium]|jgi:AGZA family xanthine/uracil permease-like MFS transporter|nr:NCS2 family permease [Synergistaceae bacterium]
MGVVDRMFKLKENGTTFSTEVLAGVTTFMTMSYIIFLNPAILSGAGMPRDAVMTATCLSAAVATILMAFMANYPVALAPGMGLNAFFAFAVVKGMGVSWRVALAAVFVEGIIFVALTTTRLRESLVNSIPVSLKIGISSGVGMFVTFIGLANVHIVVANPATLIALGPLRENLPGVLSLAGLLIIIVLYRFKVKGGLMAGIIAVTVMGFALGLGDMPKSFMSKPASLTPIFAQFDFSMVATPAFWTIVITFFFSDCFDTVGTLIGVCGRCGMIDKDGKLPNITGGLMADAVGTVVGALFGTSTVTSYIESASGVAQGGRTGLTALVTGLLFFLALFFSPLLEIVMTCATAPALIFVGVYMMSDMLRLKFDDWTECVPALMAFFMMPFSYSVAGGVEFGVVLYTLGKLLTGKIADASWMMRGLTMFFIFKEALL